MPATKTAARKTRARTPAPARKRSTRGTPRSPAAAEAAVAAFSVGSVVLDAGDPRRIGRVCTIVTAGHSYQVRFADSPICMLTPHAAIVAAPAGTAGPPCTPDC